MIAIGGLHAILKHANPMTDAINQQYPKPYKDFDEGTKLSGFTMAHDVLNCILSGNLAVS
ncbi:MAG: hypothetical protein ABI402_18995 [Ferruginibacter sp.]